jgi:hypothetical protein
VAAVKSAADPVPGRAVTRLGRHALPADGHSDVRRALLPRRSTQQWRLRSPSLDRVAGVPTAARQLLDQS